MPNGSMKQSRVTIQVIHNGERIEVDYNPEEYTINQDNNFATQSIPGLSGPLVQFVNGNQRTLEMELLFDTWDTPEAEKEDVRGRVGKVTHLMEIDSDLHAPPLLQVTWGTMSFRCVLSRVTQRFIMFKPDGTPVRARLNVTFSEVIDIEQEGKRINRQTADFSKVYQVKSEDLLSGIAAQVYQDPHLWRAIAIENNITDPRAIVSGQLLRVPPLPYIDPESGEVIG